MKRSTEIKSLGLEFRTMEDAFLIKYCIFLNLCIFLYVYLLVALFCPRQHGFETLLTGEQLSSATGIFNALPRRKLYTVSYCYELSFSEENSLDCSSEKIQELPMNSLGEFIP